MANSILSPADILRAAREALCSVQVPPVLYDQFGRPVGYAGPSMIIGSTITIRKPERFRKEKQNG